MSILRASRMINVIESDLDRIRRIWAGDDPAAMLALLKERDEAKLRAWVRACQASSDRLFGSRVWPNVEHPDSWVRCVDYPYLLPLTTRAALLRCVFPPPTLHGERVQCPECGGRKEVYHNAGPSSEWADCKRCQGTGSITLPFALDPRWLTRDTLDLARVIRGFAPSNYHDAYGLYCEPHPERMPILADALMDAGCDSEEILQHCCAGVHVSGCWLVDLILSPAKGGE